MREARSAAALNHPHVVSVFDVVDDDDRTWLVMEYVDGQTLAEIIADEGRLPPQRVAAIGAQLADALARAHERGIVHRDVKPGNVLIDRGGRPKISDFGIARAHGDDQLTQTGFVTGTPGYLSPELARGGDPTPARTSGPWAPRCTPRSRASRRTRRRPTRWPCCATSPASRPRPMEHAGRAGAGDRRDDGPGPGTPLGHGHRRRAAGRDLPRRHLPARGHRRSPRHAGRRTQLLTTAAPLEATQRMAVPPGAPGPAASPQPAAPGPAPAPGRAPPARCRRPAHRPPPARARGTSRRWVPVVLVLVLLAALGAPTWSARWARTPGGGPGTPAGHRHPDGAAQSVQTPSSSPSTTSAPSSTTAQQCAATSLPSSTPHDDAEQHGADDQHPLHQLAVGGRRGRRRRQGPGGVRGVVLRRRDQGP